MGITFTTLDDGNGRYAMQELCNNMSPREDIEGIQIVIHVAIAWGI